MTKDEYLKLAYSVNYELGYQCELSLEEFENPDNKDKKYEQILADEASWLKYKSTDGESGFCESLNDDDDIKRRAEAKAVLRKLNKLINKLELAGFKGQY